MQARSMSALAALRQLSYPPPPELLDHIERKIANEMLGAMLRGSTLRILRSLHGSRRAESMSSGLSKARKNSVADNGRAAQTVVLNTHRHATRSSGRNTLYRPSQRRKLFSTTGQRAPETVSGSGAGIARAESGDAEFMTCSRQRGSTGGGSTTESSMPL